MQSAWTKEFNDIIRYVLFKDDELRTLMMLPEDIKILDFITKYFIRAGTVSEPLVNEKVRIVYGNVGTGLADDVHVLRQELSFDIYVQQKHLHDADRDRLIFRTELIAHRLNELLCDQYDSRLGGYRFRCIGESDMSTGTIGYTRYNISFAYKKTV